MRRTMYYPDELVEEVRSKNDIVDVISGYVRLQKKGSNHWGLCPFHNEKSPSFAVSEPKQMYHCFGCGESGNVYTFLMKYENYSFPEAVKVLADRAGVQLPEVDTAEMRQKANKRARLLEANKEAAKFFYYQLRTPHGEIGKKYLDKRKLSEETMHHFGLGYAGKNGAELVKYLRSKGFEDEIIKEAGLANFSERSGLVSQFWNRVMFPIQDINHRVIGFGGRVMGDGEPKYLNSPETPIFDKRRNLYGLNFARTARSGNLIICEGYMDVIAMHQAGFTQAVASLGTAFTAEQAALMHRYTENVLLAYDSDGAGVKAALRGIKILRDEGLTGKVINMKPYKDPDEFIKNLGKEAFQERIDNAENSFFFEIRILEEQFDQSDPEQKTKFHREIAAKLCEFSEDAERENYLQAVCGKYNINFENMRKLVLSYASRTGLAKPVERPRSGVQKKNNPEENAKRSQRILITWITDNPALYPKIKSYVSSKDFTDELYRKVVDRLFADLDAGNYNPAAVISMFEDEDEQRQAAELFNTNIPKVDTKQDMEKALHDILMSVKTNSYEYYAANLGADVNAITQVIEGKKALEELAKTHISID
jgi:DNA primase